MTHGRRGRLILPIVGGTRRQALVLALGVILAIAVAVGAVVGAQTADGLHLVKGTRHADRLKGTKRADLIKGRRGRDRIRARAGDDSVRGGRGRDRVKAAAGDDVINGGRGRDRLKGGRGDDRLFAGRGGAVLIGGPGRDEFNMVDGSQEGGEGDDVIRARDDSADEINCGPGNDVAEVDRVEDGVFDCEQVRTP